MGAGKWLLSSLLGLSFPLALLAEPPSIDLSLKEALQLSLENNLALYSERLATSVAEEAVVVAESAFDVELFSEVELTERRAAASASTLDSVAIPESDSRRLRTGLEKALSTGASISLESGINRNTSNNNAARNPDYSSDLGLNIRQPILRGAGQRINLAPIARAALSAERSLFALKTEVLDVLAETELAYLELVRTRASRELILSSIEQAEVLLKENQERERLGLITPLEVLQADTVLTQRQEDLIRAERRIADAVDALAAIMGTTLLNNGEEQDYVVSALPEALPELSPMGKVVASALENDTEASLQERVLEIEKIDRLLARDRAQPDFDMVGSLRYTGRDRDGETAFRAAVERQSGYNWRAGVELRFPWGFREARARLRQAERTVEAAEVELIRLKQEKALAARNAWRAVDEGRQRIEVARKALRLSEASFEQERARYNSGAVPYRNVLEAQRDLDAARANELEVRADTLRALVRLSRVDGSLLARHGFDWQLSDSLREPVDVREHPLREIISSDS